MNHARTGVTPKQVTLKEGEGPQASSEEWLGSSYHPFGKGSCFRLTRQAEGGRIEAHAFLDHHARIGQGV